MFYASALAMSPLAHAYRTCKHPRANANAYACVVRVNQALAIAILSLHRKSLRLKSDKFC